jgi:DNA-binding FadR family transcriptional regulator
MFRQGALPRKRKRFAYAFEELGGRILGDDLKPCEILPNEAEFGGELGASRMLIRKADKLLAAKSLQELRTRTGTRVPGIDPLESARSRCLGLALYRDAAIAIRSRLVRTWHS